MRRPGEDSQRNFILGVANGLFFGLGETIIDPTLVIAAFISHLTHSELWVGLVVPILDYTWYLPQLWVSGRLQSQPLKMPLYRLTAYIRAAAWVVLTAAIFFVRQPDLLLAAFTIALLTAALGAGFSGLSFLEIIGKTVPPDRRGLFFAWRLILAGLTGVGAGLLVQWLADDRGPVAFPYNFGVLFLAATLLFFGGWWSFFRVHEPPDTAVQPAASLAAQLRRAMDCLRADGNFRRFLFMRSAMLVAGAAVPFYALYVEGHLGGSVGLIGLYLAVFKAFNLGATVFLGRVSARWGYHRLMAVAAGAGGLMTVMVLGLAGAAAVWAVPGWAADWWLVPVFAVNGIKESALGVAAQSLLLEIAPPAERSLYLGFSNTVLGVVLMAASFSGVVVEYLGLPALLVISLVGYGLSTYTSLTMRVKAYAPDGAAL